ncbi:MAG: hypothetical protein ACOC47_03800 [Alkalispirochaetaceae bacterium]
MACEVVGTVVSVSDFVLPLKTVNVEPALPVVEIVEYVVGAAVVFGELLDCALRISLRQGKASKDDVLAYILYFLGRLAGITLG